MKAESISRVTSQALRHSPEAYGLVLDSEGWVLESELLAALRRQGDEWRDIDEADLERMIQTSAKQRHEMSDGRIRAMYGHSVTTEIHHVAAEPPGVLFHGTSPDAWSAIRGDGLRPMSRQHVHLAVDVETATAVGRRKAAAPVILSVDASAALEGGSRFWLGNDTIWLSDFIPARFIRVTDTPA